MPTPEEVAKQFEEALRGATTGGGTTAVKQAQQAPATPTPAGPRPTPALSPKEAASDFERRLKELATTKSGQKVAPPSLGKKAMAGKLWQNATSGEAFLKSISGGRIQIDKLDIPGLNDTIDKIVYKAIDYTINPASLAFALAAPIAIPARLIASPLGRLAVSIAAEGALGAVGAKASEIASEAVPEGAPNWVKIAAPLAAGIAAGGGSGAAVNRSLRGLAPAVQINLAKGSVKQAAETVGLKYLAPLHRIDEIVETFDDPARAPLIKKFYESTPIDPALGETTNSGKLYHAFRRQESVGAGASAIAYTGALPSGMNAFVRNADNTLANVPKARGKHWNDVLSDPDAMSKYDFTQEQARQYLIFNELMEDAETFSAINGLKTPVRDTDGKFYVPDKPPKDPELGGIHYAANKLGEGLDIGPDEAMVLHLQARYEAVAAKQFDDAIQSLTVKPNKAYLATGDGAAKTKAYGDLAAASSTLSRRFGAHQAYVNKLKTQFDEAKLNAPAARVDELAKKLIEQDLILKKVGKEWGEAQARRDIALGNLQDSYKSFRNTTKTQLPGRLFGRNDEMIDVTKWKGSFIPKDDGDRLSKWFITQTGQRIPNQPGAVVSAARMVGDAVRTSAASLDVGMPFIQGLPLLAKDPVAWADMAFQHYKAVIRPGTQARYVQKHYWEIQDMVVNGRVPAKDLEQFAALGQGGAYADIARGINQVPGGRIVTGAVGATAGRAIKRAERVYETGLLIERHKLYSAFRAMDMTAEEAGKLTRNMTGGMDTAAMGLTNSQRAMESLAFFSPKLFRSTLALVADAARPWTTTGAEAAHTLMRLTSGAAGIFMLANQAAGIAAGETEQQIDERLRQTIQPWNGGKFLSVRVGDEYYGIGGQVRAITQFLASSIVGGSDSLGLTDEGEEKNPLMKVLKEGGKLVTSRFSPLGQAVADTVTQDVLPYDEIDSIPDVFQHLLKSSLPFVFQGALEAGMDPLGDGPAVGSAAASLMGLRNQAISPFDRRDDLAVATHGIHYRDLDPTQKTEIDKLDPELKKVVDETGDKASIAYNEQKNLIDTNATNDLIGINTALQEGKLFPDRKAMRQATEEVLKARSLLQRQARNSAGLDDDLSPTSYAGRVLSAYYQTFDLAKINPNSDSSPLDYDILDSLQATLYREIAAGVFDDPAAAMKVIDDRTRFKVPPEMQWYVDNKSVIQAGGYWDAADAQYEKYAPALRENPNFEDIASFGELKARVMNLTEKGDTVNASYGNRYLKRVQSDVEKIHLEMRKRNPALDKALYENGYTTKIQKPAFIP